MNLLLALALSLAADKAPDLDKQQEREVMRVVDGMSIRGVHVDVYFTECGYQNAFYYPSAGAIIYCTEVLSLPPGVVRFVAAHEMTHALIAQLHLPYTGSEEAAADELAAIVLDASDVMDAALWFKSNPRPEDPEDDHPSQARRAYEMLCFADGSEDDSSIPGCREKYLRAADAWTRLLRL